MTDLTLSIAIVEVVGHSLTHVIWIVGRFSFWHKLCDMKCLKNELFDYIHGKVYVYVVIDLLNVDICTHVLTKNLEI